MVGGALKMASIDDLDLRMSELVRPLYDAVVAFIRDEVEPITEEFYRLGAGRSDRWAWGDGQLELLDGAKAKARELGLWNFFLPDAETGQGLSNLDYAYIANELGKNRLASECLNCSAPDPVPRSPRVVSARLLLRVAVPAAMVPAMFAKAELLLMLPSAAIRPSWPTNRPPASVRLRLRPAAILPSTVSESRLGS